MLEIFLEINMKIFAVLLIYGCFMGVIRQKACARLMQKSRSGFLMNFFNLIGTPVHETGHLIFALLFGIPVTKVCFYRTLRQASDGTLGYVNMRFKKGGIARTLANEIGAFFVGIGPLLFGPTVLACFYALLPDTIHSTANALLQKQNVLAQIKSFTYMEWIWIVVFILVAVGVSLNMELSQADLKMAWKGFLVLELLTFFFSFICYRIGYDPRMGIELVFRFLTVIAGTGCISVLIADILIILL